MTQYLVDFLNSLQGLRKTIVMFMVITISSAFRARGLIDPSNFEGLLKATVVAYFGSNAIEHYTSMVKERIMADGTKKEVDEIVTTEGTG